MGAGGGGDVDDAAWFAIFDAEVGRCLADEAEGRFAVDVEDCIPVQLDRYQFSASSEKMEQPVQLELSHIPLLIAHLMYDSIPSIPRVIHDDMDLPAAELSSLVDQDREVLLVAHVAGDRDGSLLPVVLVDGVCDGLGLLGVDVADDDLGAFVGEEAGGFGTDSLAGAGDDGCLAGEHAFGEIEVGRDLGGAVRGGHGCGGIGCVEVDCAVW